MKSNEQRFKEVEDVGDHRAALFWAGMFVFALVIMAIVRWL